MSKLTVKCMIALLVLFCGDVCPPPCFLFLLLLRCVFIRRTWQRVCWRRTLTPCSWRKEQITTISTDCFKRWRRQEEPCSGISQRETEEWITWVRKHKLKERQVITGKDWGENWTTADFSDSHLNHSIGAVAIFTEPQGTILTFYSLCCWELDDKTPPLSYLSIKYETPARTHLAWLRKTACRLCPRVKQIIPFAKSKTYCLSIKKKNICTFNSICAHTKTWKFCKTALCLAQTKSNGFSMD